MSQFDETLFDEFAAGTYCDDIPLDDPVDADEGESKGFARLVDRLNSSFEGTKHPVLWRTLAAVGLVLLVSMLLPFVLALVFGLALLALIGVVLDYLPFAFIVRL